MGALAERRRWKGMSANSIIILRGLNMADCHACDKEAFCSWATLELGREEMNGSVSVFGSFELQQCVCRRLHVNIWVVWLHVFFYHLLACLYYEVFLILITTELHLSDFQMCLFALSLVSLCGLQVPSVLPADIPWGREGVVKVPFNRWASGYRQPVPAVSPWSHLHHHWKIPLLQPA